LNAFDANITHNKRRKSVCREWACETQQYQCPHKKSRQQLPATGAKTIQADGHSEQSLKQANGH